MFVIKTVDDAGRKVFVNVCGHAKIAAPGTKWGKGDAVPEEVQKALVSMEEGTNEGVEHLRFPISVSEGRNELDKSGHGCTVRRRVQRGRRQASRALQAPQVFVCELCLQWIGQKYGTNLDPDYKLPSRKYMGGDRPPPQMIRVEKKRVIEDLGVKEEEPTFALRPRPVKEMKKVWETERYRDATEEDPNEGVHAPNVAGKRKGLVGKPKGPAGPEGAPGAKEKTGGEEPAKKSSEESNQTLRRRRRRKRWWRRWRDTWITWTRTSSRMTSSSRSSDAEDPILWAAFANSGLKLAPKIEHRVEFIKATEGPEEGFVVTVEVYIKVPEDVDPRSVMVWTVDEGWRFSWTGTRNCTSPSLLRRREGARRGVVGRHEDHQVLGAVPTVRGDGATVGGK